MQSTVTKLNTDYCIQHIMHNAIHMAKLSLNIKGLVLVELWENAKLKCSEISTFQNREIKNLRCRENIMFGIVRPESYRWMTSEYKTLFEAVVTIIFTH